MENKTDYKGQSPFTGCLILGVTILFLGIGFSKCGDDKTNITNATANEDNAQHKEQATKTHPFLFASSGDFQTAFNLFCSSVKLNFHIEQLYVNEGEAQNTFDYALNQNLSLVGSVNKSDGTVTEIIMTAKYDTANESTQNMIYCMFSIIGAVDSSIPVAKQIDVLNALHFASEGYDVRNMTTETVKNGIKYSIVSNPQMGFCFGAIRENSTAETSNQTNITNATANDNVVNSLAYNKSLLEAYPFNIIFYSTSQKADDTTYFLKGYSPDGSLETIIRYDPRDNQFWDIAVDIKKLPLHPAKSDIRILIDFTNKFDIGFSKYFDRNIKGIFEDEDKYVDEGKFVNRAKGYCIDIDGDVALNNIDLKKHPEMREQLLEDGSFLGITILNLKKPSFVVDIVNTGKTVEK